MTLDVTKTYLPSNLCDSSDGSDSSDRRDRSNISDSSDRRDSSDSRDRNDISDKKDFFKFYSNSKSPIVMKLKNSNYDEAQKLKV